ncbi:MAG TPA: FtsW/RodA/SpoVE family cell cycle protein [Anaerolineales bacterium]|nr:FtsW/RodA/SpoVE family cell cycle protein [Anaerolineales bacterium]
MFSTKTWRHFDFALMGAVLLLILFGITMIRSANLTSIDTDVQGQAGRQVIYALIGLVIVIAVSAVDYRVYSSYSLYIYGALIGLLVVVLIVGLASFGAVRWIDLGIINFQPAELGKFLITLTLGAFVTQHRERVQQFGVVVRSLIHVGLPALLIFIQPDLSTALTYGVVWFAILWSAGVRISHLGVFAGLVLALMPVVLWFVFTNDDYAYIGQRILTFLIPAADAEASQGANYNIEQALISIGSGGWFGQGYGNGSQVQLRFLKVRQTDFIYATIGNEFGFVGTVLVLLLLAFVVFRIYRIGQIARDPYGKIICFGVGTVVFFESFANIASNLNLIPVSGSVLPFLSYGGSSLWTNLIGIGLVQSVVLRHKQIEF